MTFTAIYGVLALLVLLGVFLTAHKAKGLPFALIAAGVAVLVLGVTLVVFLKLVTSAMS